MIFKHFQSIMLNPFLFSPDRLVHCKQLWRVRTEAAGREHLPYLPWWCIVIFSRWINLWCIFNKHLRGLMFLWLCPPGQFDIFPSWQFYVRIYSQVYFYQTPHVKVYLVSILTFTLLFVIIRSNTVAQLCQNKSFKFSFGWIFYSFWQTERSLLQIWNIAKTTKTICTTKKPSWIPSSQHILAWFLLFVLCFVYFIFLYATD